MDPDEIRSWLIHPDSGMYYYIYDEEDRRATRPRLFDRVRPLQRRPLSLHRRLCCIPGSALGRELIVCASGRPPRSLIITLPRRIPTQRSSQLSESTPSLLSLFRILFRRRVPFLIRHRSISIFDFLLQPSRVLSCVKFTADVSFLTLLSRFNPVFFLSMIVS